MSVRRLSAVGMAAALSLCFAVAEQALDTGPIPNWTAPPYWTPPLARDVAAWKEQGLLPEGAEVVEGLPTSALPFFAIQPCRIVDTRPGSGFSGAYGPPAMAANASRDFDLNSAAHCPGIPAGEVHRAGRRSRLSPPARSSARRAAGRWRARGRARR